MKKQYSFVLLITLKKILPINLFADPIKTNKQITKYFPNIKKKNVCETEREMCSTLAY